MDWLEIIGDTCRAVNSPVFPENYLVTDRGTVYSVRSKRWLKPSKGKSGYLYYVLCVNGERKTVKAHRLVGMAFIENKDHKPTINHKNGIRTDNRVENLEWATHKEQKNDPLTKANMERVWRNTDYKRMAEKGNYGRTPIIVTWSDGTEERFGSLRDASVATGKNYSKLSEIVNGKRKQPKSFSVRKVED